MLELVYTFMNSIWILSLKMSPYLLIGFLFAAIIHIFLPISYVSQKLGGENLKTVIKATLLGIPLPLCSCSVLPVATTLRQRGAGKAPTLSFLITTPVTGIDSIFVTYSLMGAAFTLSRIFISIVIGIVAGSLVILIDKYNHDELRDNSLSICNSNCSSCTTNIIQDSVSRIYKLKEAFLFAFKKLPEELSQPIILGLIIAGLISTLIPEGSLTKYLGSGIFSVIIATILGIPMYVCATGSIPVAVTMLLKGMSPGAAFAFLIAGPVTNPISITTINKILGKRYLLLYIITVFIVAIFSGLVVDQILKEIFVRSIPQEIAHHSFHKTDDNLSSFSLALSYIITIYFLVSSFGFILYKYYYYLRNHSKGSSSSTIS